MHEEIEIDLEEIQMMEEEEERLRKREKRRQKRLKLKQKKGGPELTSTSSVEDDEEDEDDEPETEHRPSILERFSNQFSPANTSNSMFNRHSSTGPNMSQAKRGTHSRTNSAASPMPSPAAQSAKVGQLERLMSARQERARQQSKASENPTCCNIS